MKFYVKQGSMLGISIIGLMTSLALICADKEFVKVTVDLSPYIHVVDAVKKVIHSDAEKQRSTQVKNAVESYLTGFAQEVSSKLNQQGKKLAYEILLETRDLLALMKRHTALSDDKNTDKQAKALVEKEVDERVQKLVLKLIPFHQLIQSQNAQKSSVNNQALLGLEAVIKTLEALAPYFKN